MCVNMILKGERESKRERERERKVIEYNTKRKHDMVPYYFIDQKLFKRMKNKHTSSYFLTEILLMVLISII